MTKDLSIPALRHPEKAHRPDQSQPRKPDWIRVKAPTSAGYRQTRDIMLYPESWARRGWAGVVVVELDVGPDGAVTAARVVESSGHARLDELARSTLATWRFAPATRDGVVEAGTHRQRIDFRP